MPTRTELMLKVAILAAMSVSAAPAAFAAQEPSSLTQCYYRDGQRICEPLQGPAPMRSAPSPQSRCYDREGQRYCPPAQPPVGARPRGPGGPPPPPPPPSMPQPPSAPPYCPGCNNGRSAVS